MQIPKNIEDISPEQLLKKVYEDNLEWFVRYVLKNSGTSEDARDIFQDSVSAAWLNFRVGSFNGNTDQFNAYVRQICKYKWISTLRTSPSNTVLLGDDLSAVEDVFDSDHLETTITQSKLLRASFLSIGEKCRELLRRFYFRRQSLANIANQMGHAEESIKTMKYRCMMRLRKAFLEKEENDE